MLYMKRNPACREYDFEKRYRLVTAIEGKYLQKKRSTELNMSMGVFIFLALRLVSQGEIDSRYAPVPSS